jgi:hypothetical protein
MINSHATEEWEKRISRELYLEYDWIIESQKLTLQRAAITLVDSDVFWGKWEKLTNTISISRKLIHRYSWFHVMGVLKHEIAHQLLETVYPLEAAVSAPHGEAFLCACKEVGVPQEFSGASTDLQSYAPDWRERKGDETADRLLDKVKKLLALATSSNEHESLSAMNKVRELYAKHNLDEDAAKLSNLSFSHVVITHGKKRIEMAQRKIIGILVGHFFVQVIVFSLFDAKTAERHKAIEIIGTRENVLMAEYVYYFLHQQADYLVREKEKDSGQRLTRTIRKSFTLGILQGFSGKLQQSAQVRTHDSFPNIVGTALEKFKNDPELKNYMSGLYPRTVNRTSVTSGIDGSAFHDGMSVGKSIILSKAVATDGGNQGRLLEST